MPVYFHDFKLDDVVIRVTISVKVIGRRDGICRKIRRVHQGLH